MAVAIPASTNIGAPTSGSVPAHVSLSAPLITANGLYNTPAAPCDKIANVGLPIFAPV